MVSKFSKVGVAFAMSVFPAAIPLITNASEIALKFKDNGITISGEFAGFRDGSYIVVTEAGELHVPAHYVTCGGDDCIVVFETTASDSN